MLFREFIIIIIILQCNSVLLEIIPEQIHLSLGASPNEMMITWATMSRPQESIVRYHQTPNGSSKNISAKITHFNYEKLSIYIHRAKLTNLLPDHDYKYTVGGDHEWSKEFQFRTLREDDNFQPHLAVFGDLGYENGKSLPHLIKDVNDNLYDAIIHLGDLGYDLHSHDGKIGNLFMNSIEPIAAKVPYQVCPGNHEHHGNFTHYDNRFTMIDSNSGEMNNLYYSINIGKAHIIFFTTEMYYYPETFDEHNRKRQYHWIEEDLKEATKSLNIKKRPWIITVGHRPMYCYKTEESECSHYEGIVRKGRTGHDLKKISDYGLEDLFYKYGVDLEFWGHEHYWHRMYPVYDKHVYNGSHHEPYHNPKAPVHILTGSGGNKELHMSISHHPQIWTAKIIKDYGYTRMNILNSTHLSLKQISVEKNTIVDEIMIIKEKHGPEAYE